MAIRAPDGANNQMKMRNEVDGESQTSLVPRSPESDKKSSRFRNWEKIWADWKVGTGCIYC